MRPPDQDSTRVRRALIEAGLALGSALSLAQVLQILVDVAREILDARYAALGVIDTAGTGLSDFVTSGMPKEMRARIGDLPHGKGILGLLITDARPLRLRDLNQHPASVGVPPNHPPMRSFMGVPVVAQGRVFGNLYVTEKIGADEFSEEDLALLEVLATQAAVAIERARLRAGNDRLTSAASHALGNALAAVRLWAGTLLQTPPSSQAEWIEGVTHIAGSAAQSARLVDDLVTLTRIQEGSIALHAERVDLADLVRKSALDLQTESAARAVSLDVHAEGPLLVELDGACTRRLLLNLLAHAIAMSPERSRVSAELTYTAKGDAELRVRDAGPPVAASDVESLFDPPIAAGVHARGRGFGFELAVARQLARLMGGEITVEGLEQGGAVFTIRLPTERQR
ncbi:MAG TPA: GAF domain-containing protein [Gemmatimonadaceae bacterium]|nr:GAF domain-containing protein [Gemmatimonadaceae bacterium]